MSGLARRGPLQALGALATWVRPRRWRLVGLSLLLLAYAFLWVLEVHATDGLRTQLFSLVITVPAILVLLAGGNLLQGWIGVHHRPPRFHEPERDAASDEPGGDATP